MAATAITDYFLDDENHDNELMNESKELSSSFDGNVETEDIMRGGTKDDDITTFTLLVYDLKKKITCKVNSLDSLWTLKRRILASPAYSKFADGLNYGFYCPARSGRVGKYLCETRPVKEFSQKDLDKVEFRYKKKIYKDLPSNLKKLKHVNDLSHRKSFFHAVNSLKVNEITKLLKKGHDPNYQDFKTGETPMTCAIQNSAPADLLMNLMEGGSHLDYRNTLGATPVHVAASRGNEKLLKTLLDLGASPNVRNADNLTPLHCLSSGVNLEALVPCCQLLLENYSVVDVADEAGNTELHHACRQGRLSLVKKLIVYGANINRQNTVGNTPLHVAIFNSQEDLSKELLIYGADKSIANRANYNPFAAALTAGNQSLAEYIECFHPSQEVSIDEKPSYNLKRKANTARRPSMQAFMETQRKHLLARATIIQRLSFIGDTDADDESRNSLESSYKTETITSRASTAYEEPHYKTIGPYISKMFGKLEGEDKNNNFETGGRRTETNTNSLAVPNASVKMFSSSSNIDTNQYSSDEFSDSDNETIDEAAVAATRKKNKQIPLQIRPTSFYEGNRKQEGSSARLVVTSAPQKQPLHYSSMMSLTTNNASPMPLKKLQPAKVTQEEKTASIRSYPIRLMSTENLNSLSLSAAYGKELNQNKQLYPATANPTAVKTRPSLKEMFPIDSQNNFHSMTKRPLPNVPVSEPYGVCQSAPVLDDSNLHNFSPAYNFRRENIYDKIPAVSVTSFDDEHVTIDNVLYKKIIKIGTKSKSESRLNNAALVQANEAALDGGSQNEDEIYGNIGDDGLPLNFSQGRWDRRSSGQSLDMTEEARVDKYFFEALGDEVDALSIKSLAGDDLPLRKINHESKGNNQTDFLVKSQQIRQNPHDDGTSTNLQTSTHQQSDNLQQYTEQKPSPPKKNPHLKLIKVSSNQPDSHDLQPKRGKSEKHETNGKQRPMSSFFDASQLSLSSLDSPDSSKFQSIPIAQRIQLLQEGLGNGTFPRSSFNLTSGERNDKVTNVSEYGTQTRRSKPREEAKVRQKQLLAPQSTIPKAGSYQDISVKKSVNASEPNRTSLLGLINDSKYAKSHVTLAELPPPPLPQRTSSDRSGFVLPPPPVPDPYQDLDPMVDELLPPPPSFIPEATPTLFFSRKQLDASTRSSSNLVPPKIDSKASRSLTSSPSPSSNFESLNSAQQDIKRRVLQLQLSSNDDSEVAKLKIVPGKSTSGHFNEDQQYNSLPDNQQYYSLPDNQQYSSLPDNQDSVRNMTWIIDSNTGQRFIRMSDPPSQDWAA